MQIIYIVIAVSNFPPTNGIKWIDPEEFDLNKSTNNSSRVYVLQDDLENSQELRKLHSNCLLGQNKIEIKRETFFKYQLKVVDLYNIFIDNAKKVGPDFFIKQNM